MCLLYVIRTPVIIFLATIMMCVVLFSYRARLWMRICRVSHRIVSRCHQHRDPTPTCLTVARMCRWEGALIHCGITPGGSHLSSSSVTPLAVSTQPVHPRMPAANAPLKCALLWPRLISSPPPRPVRFLLPYRCPATALTAPGWSDPCPWRAMRNIQQRRHWLLTLWRLPLQPFHQYPVLHGAWHQVARAVSLTSLAAWLVSRHAVRECVRLHSRHTRTTVPRHTPQTSLRYQAPPETLHCQGPPETLRYQGPPETLCLNPRETLCHSLNPRDHSSRRGIKTCPHITVVQRHHALHRGV